MQNVRQTFERKVIIMKKKIAVLLSAVMAMASFTACGASKESDNNDSTKTYKVGIVKYVDDASLDQIQNAICKELDAKGKELGVKFDYSEYTHNGQADQSTLTQIMTDLVSDEVDAIVPIATPAAVVAQSATEDNQIPVVFSAVSDPVSANLVESIDAPGANVTGTSDALDTNAIFNLILAANPDIKSIGLLYDNGQDSSKKSIEDAKKFCKEHNIEVVEKTGTTNDEISLAAEALVAAKVEAVFTPTDNTVMKAELAIYEKFEKAKIPHYAGADSFALNGAFCGYGVNYSELGTATADMVVDILENGSKPENTAVKTLDNGIATVNTEIAGKIGIDFSSFKDMCEDVKEITTAESFE